MFVVKRHVKTYEEVWSEEVTKFFVETDAHDFAAAEDRCRPWDNEWHTVEEE